MGRTGTGTVKTTSRRGWDATAGPPASACGGAPAHRRGGRAVCWERRTPVRAPPMQFAASHGAAYPGAGIRAHMWVARQHQLAFKQAVAGLH